MQKPEWLALCWRSLLGNSRYVDASILGRKGNQNFDYQTHKTKNRWRIIDMHFQDGSTSMSLSIVPIQFANTITLEGCDYAAVCLPKM